MKKLLNFSSFSIHQLILLLFRCPNPHLFSFPNRHTSNWEALHSGLLPSNIPHPIKEQRWSKTDTDIRRPISFSYSFSQFPSPCRLSDGCHLVPGASCTIFKLQHVDTVKHFMYDCKLMKGKQSVHVNTMCVRTCAELPLKQHFPHLCPWPYMLQRGLRS